MSTYIVRKLVLLPVILLGITSVIFLIMHLTPGDPAEIALGDKATPELVAQLRADWGLDRPLAEQYGRFLFDAIRGELGKSFRTNRPVTEEIAARFPATALLTVSSLVVSLLIGIPAGIVAAIRRRSLFDNLSMLVALIGLSMPVFWTGILLIVLFSFYLGWLPTSGLRGPESLVLPSLTLGSASAAIIARLTRSSMLEVLREDYVRTARAKGLASRAVIYRHALRSALIPVLTVLGIQIGTLMGGAIIIESVFAWPGIGTLMITSILARDAAVIRGSVLVFATIFVVVNLLTDVLYAVVDPRIQYG